MVFTLRSQVLIVAIICKSYYSSIIMNFTLNDRKTLTVTIIREGNTDFNFTIYARVRTRLCGGQLNWQVP
jgi:hypothetical protein